MLTRADIAFLVVSRWCAREGDHRTILRIASLCLELSKIRADAAFWTRIQALCHPGREFPGFAKLRGRFRVAVRLGAVGRLDPVCFECQIVCLWSDEGESCVRLREIAIAGRERGGLTPEMIREVVGLHLKGVDVSCMIADILCVASSGMEDDTRALVFLFLRDLVWRLRGGREIVMLSIHTLMSNAGHHEEQRRDQAVRTMTTVSSHVPLLWQYHLPVLGSMWRDEQSVTVAKRIAVGLGLMTRCCKKHIARREKRASWEGGEEGGGSGDGSENGVGVLVHVEDDDRGGNVNEISEVGTLSAPVAPVGGVGAVGTSGTIEQVNAVGVVRPGVLGVPQHLRDDDNAVEDSMRADSPPMSEDDASDGTDEFVIPDEFGEICMRYLADGAVSCRQGTEEGWQVAGVCATQLCLLRGWGLVDVEGEDIRKLMLAMNTLPGHDQTAVLHGIGYVLSGATSATGEGWEDSGGWAHRMVCILHEGGIPRVCKGPAAVMMAMRTLVKAGPHCSSASSPAYSPFTEMCRAAAPMLAQVIMHWSGEVGGGVWIEEIGDVLSQFPTEIAMPMLEHLLECLTLLETHPLSLYFLHRCREGRAMEKLVDLEDKDCVYESIA